jgi:short-subunit dehydrogenase
MTSSFKKGLLWATPEKIGLGIYKSIDTKSDITYLPWFWKWIMLILKIMPEQLFKRLKI